jgi:hypothetical protein
VQAERQPRSRDHPLPFATALAFTLCLSFCVVLAYGVHRFFGAVTATHDSTQTFVFEVRGAIYALSVVTAIACIMLGFAIFMIGGRGEFKVSSEVPALKGMVSATAPGLFFVLCGTVMICVLLSNRFVFEASGQSQESQPSTTGTKASGTNQPSDTPFSSAAPTESPKPSRSQTSYVMRSIASGTPAKFVSTGDEITTQEGFYFESEAAFQVLSDIVSTGQISDALATTYRDLWTAEGDIRHVRFRWNLNENKPADNLLNDVNVPGQSHSFTDGYLLVPAQDNWQLVRIVDSLRTIQADERENGGSSAINWKSALAELKPRLKRTFVFFKGNPTAFSPKKTKP